ncbi:MAG: hydroxymethylbilane synthase, partial [Acidimicrobiia bacterium]
TPIREDPSEALVGGTLEALPAGARVGTGSPRRTAQLRALRPDLDVRSIRGNVPTRVEKVRNGEYDAAVLANAGLKRLGIEADEVIPPVRILPAPGQGALAVEVRADDGTSRVLLGAIEDHHVRAEVTAEREVLRNLGGGCLLPVGTYARILEGSLVLDAAVAALDGSKVIRARYSGPIVERSDIAMEVSNQLRANGALALLEPEGAKEV